MNKLGITSNAVYHIEVFIKIDFRMNIDGKCHSLGVIICTKKNKQ